MVEIRPIFVACCADNFVPKSGGIQKKIIFAYFFPQKVAVIAQSVEHFTRNEKVSGSSPDYGS